MVKAVVTQLENIHIRQAARVANVPLWKIASELGISEPTFTRWLRLPLDAEREKKIILAIERITGGGEMYAKNTDA